MFSFPCPGCQKKYKADESLIGKDGLCKRCGYQFVVPAVWVQPPPPPPERVRPTTVGVGPDGVSMHFFNCPACRRRLKAESAEVDDDAKCPWCKHEFEVPRPPSPPAAPRSASERHFFPCPDCQKLTVGPVGVGIGEWVECYHCRRQVRIPGPPSQWVEDAKMVLSAAGIIALVVVGVASVWLYAVKDKTPVKREPRNWQELERDLRDADRNAPSWQRGVGGRGN